jgi:hypothetical protein
MNSNQLNDPIIKEYLKTNYPDKDEYLKEIRKEFKEYALKQERVKSEKGITKIEEIKQRLKDGDYKYAPAFSEHWEYKDANEDIKYLLELIENK